jgi:hypothetical protein
MNSSFLHEDMVKKKMMDMIIVVRSSIAISIWLY